MGCLPCFDSSNGYGMEQLRSSFGRHDQEKRMDHPMDPPKVDKFPHVAGLTMLTDTMLIAVGVGGVPNLCGEYPGVRRAPSVCRKSSGSALIGFPYLNIYVTGSPRTRKAHSKKVSMNHKDGFGINISAQIFTLRELAAATKNFKPESFLGEGGFGRVYKGRLESTGQVVAVKQLDTTGLQGNREFLVEVLMLSLLHHPNLVNLIGYCSDGEQRLLVYEFMPLGSLEDHLHDLPSDKEALDWNTRMKIAAGAARGLEHLHDKADPPVIYRDFKSSNILLDKGFHPKLSDFGLAKLGPTGDKSHVSTRVMGTYGYCAPEYAMTGQLTIKSDVYSFGVVLMELITGRKAIDTSKPNGQQSLVAWARPMFNDRNKLPKLADPRLKGRFPMRGLYQALAIASMCIQEDFAARPLIGDVVTALSYLASQAYDPAASAHSRGGGTHDDQTNGSSLLAKCDYLEKGEEPPKEVARTANKDFDRERAVAEAKMWGENLREKRRAADTT